MIKFIYGKTGEGKSRESLREIESDDNIYNVGVFSHDSDFDCILTKFGDEEKLKTKNIFIYDSNETVENVLVDGSRFDMIILELTKDWSQFKEEVKKCECKKIIITQQVNSLYC